MGVAPNIYRGGERHLQGFGGRLMERDHLKDLGLDLRIILTFRNRASYI
jgi:hypothetical protein